MTKAYAINLHFFEPRYKVLIRRAWEGSRVFLWAQTVALGLEFALLVRHEAEMVHRTAQLVVADPLEQRLQRIQHVVVADLVVADRFPDEEHFGCVLGLDLHCMDEGFDPLDIPGFPDFRQNRSTYC